MPPLLWRGRMVNKAYHITSLYIKRGKVSVRTHVRNARRGKLSSEYVITRMTSYDDNSWLMEIWRLVTCGHGLQRFS